MSRIPLNIWNDRTHIGHCSKLLNLKCLFKIMIRDETCPGYEYQLNTEIHINLTLLKKCLKSLRLRSLLCLRSFLWQKLSGCRDFFPLSFPFDKQTKNMITWYQPKMINVKTSLKSSKAMSWRGVAYKLHVIGAPLETQRQRNLILTPNISILNDASANVHLQKRTYNFVPIF